jgi:transposase-like protein
METPKTLLDAITFFSDAENCRQFMISVRWMDGIVRCPRCGSEDVSYMPNAKQYHCKAKHEKSKFSLKVGTIFEDSPIGLEKWLPTAWLISNCKNGISSYEVARALGVTQKSAWHMLHRLREAMNGGLMFKIGGNGPVEVDETHFGPNTRKMHASKRTKLAKEGYQKPAVMGMLDRESRQVRAKVVPNVKRETLQNEILNQIEGGSTVYTDCASAYDNLAMNDYIHETVNHVEEYVRGNVHTNGIENLWAGLKRSLRGTYVAVEPFHLDRYVTEQVFRFNNRATKDNPLNDADRFTLLISQIVGKRLTYAELTGRLPQQPA